LAHGTKVFSLVTGRGCKGGRAVTHASRVYSTCKFKPDPAEVWSFLVGGWPSLKVGAKSSLDFGQARLVAGRIGRQQAMKLARKAKKSKNFAQSPYFDVTYVHRI
jgi:hypothetical protein